MSHSWGFQPCASSRARISCSSSWVMVFMGYMGYNTLHQDFVSSSSHQICRSLLADYCLTQISRNVFAARTFRSLAEGKSKGLKAISRSTHRKLACVGFAECIHSGGSKSVATCKVCVLCVLCVSHKNIICVSQASTRQRRHMRAKRCMILCHQFHLVDKKESVHICVICGLVNGKLKGQR